MRGLTPPRGPKIGRDGKWQLNLYDPNLTRVELMEPKPVRTPAARRFSIIETDTLEDRPHDAAVDS